jgi:hypothetical protein
MQGMELAGAQAAKSAVANAEFPVRADVTLQRFLRRIPSLLFCADRSALGGVIDRLPQPE